MFHPSWWHKNADITFDESFFYGPLRRVEDEQKRIITDSIKASGDDLTKTGLCCVNMDNEVSDKRIYEIFEIVERATRTTID